MRLSGLEALLYDSRAEKSDDGMLRDVGLVTGFATRSVIAFDLGFELFLDDVSSTVWAVCGDESVHELSPDCHVLGVHGSVAWAAWDFDSVCDAA